MPDMKDIISKKRIPVAPPQKLVVDGKAVFGTFSSEIPEINLLDCVDPCGNKMPDIMKKSRLKLWEAYELTTPNGILLAAVYNNGQMLGFTVIVYFDKKKEKVTSWLKFGSVNDAKVAPNLINSVTEMHTRNSDLVIENQLQNGICHIYGGAQNRQSGRISFEAEIKRLSEPSVVNIPFGDNKPLYSQKDFFSATGYLEINGVREVLDGVHTTSIIDDHKGYYPFKAHYDWLTTMGRIGDEFFSFNLTRNQSINQNDYNENLIWCEGISFPLPPVTFQKDGKTWHILDQYGLVDLQYDIIDTFKIQIHLGVVDIDYKLPFGKLSGYLKNTDGKVFRVDGLYGIAEDKTTRI